jgi:hypothetical protein
MQAGLIDDDVHVEVRVLLKLCRTSAREQVNVANNTYQGKVDTPDQNGAE